MIKIICLGKLKEKYLVDLVSDYANRINKYHKLELIELKDEEDLEREANNILKYIGKNDYVITLEIEGKQLTSEEFSKKIEDIQMINSNITFIIGGSYGIDHTIKEKANYHISFSKMTFPHQLFRVLLLEQIYRAFKIMNHESYHK